MKKLLSLSLILLFLGGCQKEEFEADTGTVEKTDSSTQAEIRAYEQDVCGLVEKFCSEKRKALPASIEDDLIKFRVDKCLHKWRLSRSLPRLL